MKLLFLSFLSLYLLACNSTAKKGIIYTKDEQKLIYLLDSIGNLDKDELINKVSFYSDSVLHNQNNLDITLTDNDFKRLIKAINKRSISSIEAKQIFQNLNYPNKNQEEELQINCYSFDEDTTKFDHFAITFNDYATEEHEVYFFQSKKLIAKHHIPNRYGLELEHFKNNLNQTVIYYPSNFMNGTSIWWNQTNFYQYDNGKLIPVLTALNDCNLQPSFSIRSFWIESNVVSTNPLKIQFKYDTQFFHETNNPLIFLKDSTVITYKLNNQTGRYSADFTHTKLNKYQLQSFSLADNDLLFVSSFYKEIKFWLSENNPTKSKAIFSFLKELRKRIDEDSSSL